MMAARALDLLRPARLAQNDRRAIAGGSVRMHGMRILFNDLPGLRVDQPAVAIEDRDRDGLAAGGALALLGGHRFVGLEARGAVGAVETVPFSQARSAGHQRTE